MTCKETTEKVDKLLSDIQGFMEDFHNSSACNTVSTNSTINNLVSSLQSEKAGLMKEDLVLENKIMDELAVKTEKVKVLSIKLSSTNKKIDEFKSEKAVIKSCVATLNTNLHSLIETDDYLLNISIRQYLPEKLKPIFSMLDSIEGVLESSIPKQGGEPVKTSGAGKPTEGEDDHEQKAKSKDPKGNVSSGSKGKEKLINEDDEEEKEENEKLKHKSHNEEHDEKLRVAKEAEKKKRLLVK
ncbi:unnamed protein product [Lactuca saligna]|uniref:Uncharacterized protein n=1 Tax=Lactuca saligna TaxID=75948 RepID=A0AA35Y8H5_LACSI|nr:unnamed protein product [Lactuca saligna]